MSEPGDRMDARIEAYLDGGLTDAQRDEIESGRDAAAAGEVGLQRRIDGRLRVLMSVPAGMPTAEAAPADVAGRVGARAGASKRWMLAAAAVILCAAGVWAGVAQPWRAWIAPGPSPLAANVAYDRLVKAGFEPDWVCTTDEEFAKYSREKLGVELAAKPAGNVSLVGWTYMTGLLKEEAQVLMAKVDGQPVLIVMGHAKDDLKMHVDNGSALHVHRAVEAGLVLYEVSPRDSMAVLPGLHGKKYRD